MEGYENQSAGHPRALRFCGRYAEGIRAAAAPSWSSPAKAASRWGRKKGFAAAQKKGIATLFFVNKLDNENADFYKVFEDLKATFGPMVCPLVVPYVEDQQVKCYINLLEYKAYAYKDGKATAVPIPDMGHRLEGLRTAINEAVAETSEELMEKYFSGEAFTPDELIMGIASGVRKGEIARVLRFRPRSQRRRSTAERPDVAGALGGERRGRGRDRSQRQPGGAVGQRQRPDSGGGV